MPPTLVADHRLLDVVAGSVVVVRDEEWLVTQVAQTQDGTLVTVQGLSELVRDTTAQFYSGLDEITVFDPRQTTVVGDSSPNYRRARLWLEATLRKTVVPVGDTTLTVVGDMLADPLDYQHAAVRKALNPETLRPRILLADAVGLGKTLEIGMILSELVRRGRGERILVVTPRHVLEQMQHELWTRFALPFIRLDSVGIQRVRRRLPASRNPFSVYKRAIISIDTLKSDRYLAHLRKQRWDAVVIDESHNVTNSQTQNNRLASELAPRTDALILASATPHNGRKESFAELVRLLEPTAVTPDGELAQQEVERLVVRRHRHSPEVAGVVGADWAERLEPQNILVSPSSEEDAVAQELSDTWLYPTSGRSPASGTGSRLFGWTLAKAFLSSPAALVETVDNRMKRRSDQDDAEASALERLKTLALAAEGRNSGKYHGLRKELERIGIGPDSPERVVVFAERVATLHWLQTALMSDLKMTDRQVRAMHGALSDVEQQELVEEFKQESAPVRILITGDVASEGVNLHRQCHEIIHYDIPWSLIRIEQRNGRIDRYGQTRRPRITTLLLEPTDTRFTGDLKVLASLVAKEDEAHRALGDSASLMGRWSVEAEEDAIRDVLAGRAFLEDVVATPEDVLEDGGIAALLARLGVGTGTTAAANPEAPQPDPDGRPRPKRSTVLYESQVDYLRDALAQVYPRPGDAPDDLGGGGVGWIDHGPAQIVELTPPADLRARLELLPQEYRRDRRVTERLKLATTRTKAQAELLAALRDDVGASWPEAHYLGPLHPVLDWVSDRVLAVLPRGQVYAVRGLVDGPTVLLVATLTNRAGHTVSTSWLEVAFPELGSPGRGLVVPHESVQDLIASVGLDNLPANPGSAAGTTQMTHLVARAVDAAERSLGPVFDAAEQEARERVDAWTHRVRTWEDEADALTQRSAVKMRRVGVEEERKLLEERRPERRHLRPLLVVVPADHPTTTGKE